MFTNTNPIIGQKYVYLLLALDYVELQLILRYISFKLV